MAAQLTMVMPTRRGPSRRRRRRMSLTMHGASPPGRPGGESPSMVRYILRRLLLLGPLLVGITMVSWAAIQLAPGSGDYFQQLVLQYPQISPKTIAALRAQFGMDQPPWIQYLRWLWSILHLNFGLSFAYN